MTGQQKPERWRFGTDRGKTAEGRTLRPLIYLDDVLQAAGVIETRTTLQLDHPQIAMTVNGRPATPVAPAVFTKDGTVIWRFKTIS